MDQAAALRAMRDLRPAPPAADGRGAVVVGSGKGGVGKSTLAVLLARALALRSGRVLLVDGAQNQGNLHVLLGLRPAAPLTALLDREVEPAGLPVPAGPGLWLLPAESGNPELHALGRVDRARLHCRLSTLFDGFDRVVVDGGPGIDNVVRNASIRAERLLVVTVPEPAALSDAYALIKIVHLHAPGLPVSVLVNRTRDAEEGAACFARLELAARRFLALAPDFLGSVAEDESLRAAALHARLLEAAVPASVDALAARLVACRTDPAEMPSQ
jgi:flagellar biosynthesis protein FlhG